MQACDKHTGDHLFYIQQKYCYFWEHCLRGGGPTQCFCYPVRILLPLHHAWSETLGGIGRTTDVIAVNHSMGGFSEFCGNKFIVCEGGRETNRQTDTAGHP